MIQNQTEISIKDNSGLLLGRCINAGKSHASVGTRVRVAVLKSKAITKRKKMTKRSVLQDLLLIQTKKIIIRKDGSTVRFNGNRGVCVTTGRGGKLQMGFKRINTAVAVELKKSQRHGTLNLMKLAKGLV